MNTPKKLSSQAITFPHRHSTELKAYLIGLHVYQLHHVIGYLAWRGRLSVSRKKGELCETSSVLWTSITSSTTFLFYF